MYRTINISKKIKLIISDFDGVFTDGGFFVGDNNISFKKVSFKDLMGISIAIKNGLKIAFISGEKTPAIDLICKKFNIEDNYQGIRDKKTIVNNLLSKYFYKPDEVAYVGDDINDIEGMKLVKYRIAPPNANYKVKELENIQITSSFGGDGAFREIIDNIID